VREVRAIANSSASARETILGRSSTSAQA
jgi:hypothetical protein